MSEATDICSVCDKVDDLRSMEYLRPDMPFDDRLICEKCKRDDNLTDTDIKIFIGVYATLSLVFLGLLFVGTIIA